MKNVLGVVLASWVAIGAMAAGAGELRAAQRAQATKVPASTPPRTVRAAGTPDWSGIWEVDWRNTRKSPPPPPMKLTPEYQKRLDAFRAARTQGENLQTQGANCVPPGLPRIMTQPYPVEFVFAPGKVVMLIEAYMQFRHIYTDGRKHPDDPDPTFMGHSTGRWEGDTLVVDSVGFTDATQVADGVPHSPQLRIVERIRKVSAEFIEIQTTLIDPVVLAEPYTSTRSYRHLDDDLQEYICLENNRDSADEKGRPGMSLEKR